MLLFLKGDHFFHIHATFSICLELWISKCLLFCKALEEDLSNPVLSPWHHAAHLQQIGLSIILSHSGDQAYSGKNQRHFSECFVLVNLNTLQDTAALNLKFLESSMAKIYSWGVGLDFSFSSVQLEYASRKEKSEMGCARHLTELTCNT